MTDPPPDGGGAVIAMNQALRESGLPLRTSATSSAHGTGTPGGDVSETVAIKRTFGEHARKLVISSPKSMTGHTTAAAGALNLLAGCYAMRDGVVSPTINHDHADPECDLDCVPNVARELPVARGDDQRVRLRRHQRRRARVRPRTDRGAPMSHSASTVAGARSIGS